MITIWQQYPAGFEWRSSILTEEMLYHVCCSSYLIALLNDEFYIAISRFPEFSTFQSGVIAALTRGQILIGRVILPNSFNSIKLSVYSTVIKSAEKFPYSVFNVKSILSCETPSFYRKPAYSFWQNMVYLVSSNDNSPMKQRSRLEVQHPFASPNATDPLHDQQLGWRLSVGIFEVQGRSSERNELPSPEYYKCRNEKDCLLNSHGCPSSNTWL